MTSDETQCPKCFSPREPDATECPQCGVIFSKWEASLQNDNISEPSSETSSELTPEPSPPPHDYVAPQPALKVKPPIPQPDIASILLKEWKAIVFFIWMLCLTGFLFYMNSKIDRIEYSMVKVQGTVDGVQSFVSATDVNVSAINKSVNNLKSEINAISIRVKRCR